MDSDIVTINKSVYEKIIDNWIQGEKRIDNLNETKYQDIFYPNISKEEREQEQENDDLDQEELLPQETENIE